MGEQLPQEDRVSEMLCKIRHSASVSMDIKAAYSLHSDQCPRIILLLQYVAIFADCEKTTQGKIIIEQKS